MNRLPVLRRLGKAFVFILAGLLLTVITAWVGAYFWLGSTSGRAALRAAVADMSPVIGVEFVRWGPSPDRLIIGMSSVDDADGAPLAALRMADVDVALWALVGGDLHIERLHIELSHVHANIGPDGRVDLLVRLAPPKKPPSAPATDARKKPRPTLRIDDLQVRIDELVLTSKKVDGVVIRDVDLAAALTFGDTLRLSSRLSLGQIDATWDRARKNIGFDGLTVTSLEVDDQSFQARGLTLTRAGEVIVAAELTSRPGDGTGTSPCVSEPRRDEAQRDVIESLARLRPALPRACDPASPGLYLTLDAALGPADAAALVPDTFPAGLDILGLELEVHSAAPAAPTTPSAPTLPPEARATSPDAPTTPAVGQRISGRLGHLRAPAWRVSAFSADHLELSLHAFEVELDRLIPRVVMDFGHLAAARLFGLGWNLEGLYLPGGHLDFTHRLQLALGPGKVFGWTLGPSDDPEGAPGPNDPLSADLALTADLGLTGGPIHARLGGDFGILDAIGRLKLSPLTGRTGFNTTVSFADLAGPPLTALAHDLGQLGADALARLEAARPDGHAVFELEVERDRKTLAWESVITWDEGSFVIPGWLLLWDGDAWAETVPANGSKALPDPDPNSDPDPDAPTPREDP